MNEARLAAGVEASALLARARDLGGFGTVLRRGDAERGSLMLVIAERGTTRFLVQRLLQRDGRYQWESRESADGESLDAHLANAQSRDPDLWVIELDVPSAERFIAEMT
ncbi:DUF1491 family protein [Sphingomonas kaistensis]|uniref:DUF1491 family protein n=1 Tax=Sphingomonas kaistensis TaxID=298708 RepID=A0ABZ2FY82_9SPHN